jgi:chromosome segregation ATPase
LRQGIEAATSELATARTDVTTTEATLVERRAELGRLVAQGAAAANALRQAEAQAVDFTARAEAAQARVAALVAEAGQAQEVLTERRPPLRAPKVAAKRSARQSPPRRVIWRPARQPRPELRHG